VTSKKISEQRPEAGMTQEEAASLASIIASQLEDMGRGGVEDFILLLRWYAYKAIRDDVETVYIRTEQEYAYHFDGVDEAVRGGLQRTLDALRRRQKGGGQ
jgi:DNA-binding XRE family transcriptional regulator